MLLKSMAMAMAMETIALLAEEQPEPERADRFRLLVISSDPYPPSRVDVSVLFGEELTARGHTIDWLLQSEAPCDRSYVASWGGGRVWVAAADRRPGLLSALRKHFAA